MQNNIIEKFEENYDWKSSIDFYFTIDKDLSMQEKINLTVRIMFMVTYCLLEFNYTSEDEIKGIQFLKKVYKPSLIEFNNNADFLFCLGIITKLNEFDFDLDVDEPDKFLKKSIELCPHISLFRSWYEIHTSKRFEINEEQIRISLQNTFADKYTQQWKEEKGSLGKYVVDWLEVKYLSIS